MLRTQQGREQMALHREFTNGYGEECSVTLEYSGDTAEWIVRTSRRSLARCGGLVTVTTTETVGSYYSHRQAARGANWSLYLLAAGQEVSHFDY